MSIPNYSAEMRAIFEAHPDEAQLLNTMCDQTEADRAQFGEDDARVQAGEVAVNGLKGKFTRRFAWAAYQHDKRFGLRRKSSGAIATRRDGVPHSTDALMLRDNGQIIDVMSDRAPSWSVNDGDTQPVEQWVEPIPENMSVPVPVPEPVPEPQPNTPPPAPSPDPTTDDDQMMHNLFELLDALHHDNVAAMQIAKQAVQSVADLRTDLGNIKIPAAPKSLTGKIPYLGPITLTPQY